MIANIPTFLEKDAYNPVESYQKDADGTIATTFTFNDGDFDGEQKIYQPRGFVVDNSNNAIWGMQFVWPIKADYRIVYLDDSYQQTIIGRKVVTMFGLWCEHRKYLMLTTQLWLMWLLSLAIKRTCCIKRPTNNLEDRS